MGRKSVGLIKEDPVTGLQTYAKVMGVLACAAPSTPPAFNTIFVAINGLKSGNAIISSSHPNAKLCATREVEVMHEALERIGAPVDLIQMVEDPSIERSQLLMKARALTPAASPALALDRSMFRAGLALNTMI